MALFGGRGNDERRARAAMSDAASAGMREDYQEKLQLRTGDEKFAKTYRNRGRLYDKLNVSVHTMDIIIYTVSALIVAAIVIGIVIGQ